MFKKIIIFDLDGTLAESKLPMDSEMASLLRQLLAQRKVAVISGGAYKQFKKQFLGSLDASKEELRDLYLFPTCATSFYANDSGDWQNIYSENLLEGEKQKIKSAFDLVLSRYPEFATGEKYGEIIEDRGTQITFSALGQSAPLDKKKLWDPDQKKRLKIKSELEKILTDFEIRLGGTTSIDVTRKGIDKAYGVLNISKHLGIAIDEMLFVGDAVYPGGNDYPAKEAGVHSIQVAGPDETKEVIRKILNEK